MKKLQVVLCLASLTLILGSNSLVPATAQPVVPLDHRFGAVEAFWDTNAAVEAGFAWERILFYWEHIQPNGPDDWNTMHVPDEWLQWAQDQGREVVGLLKNSPQWATDGAPGAGVPRGLDLPIEDPNNLWAAFVRKAVQFYAPRGIHHWIIWNEPDISPGTYGQEWGGSIEEYARLLKVSYQVIKQVDPGATIHLAGLTYWHDQGYLNRLLDVIAADPQAADYHHYFDVVSLHIYFQTDTVDLIIGQAYKALTAHGLNKAVWINETNASPDSDPQWPLVRPRWRVDLREQASFILQAHALGLAAGAHRIAIYKLIDAGLPPGGEPFGLLRPDHSRRPAFDAYKLVTQHYASAQWGKISRQPDFAQVTLARGANTTRVFWARTQNDVTINVPALAAQAWLISQEGQVQTLDGSSGSYNLSLPGARCADEVLGCIIGGPTYLLVEKAPADDAGQPIVTAQATPTPLPFETPAASATPSPAESVTPEPTTTLASATEVYSPTPTLDATATPPTPSPSSTASNTPTATASATTTKTPTASPSATATMYGQVGDSSPPTPTATGYTQVAESSLSTPSATEYRRAADTYLPSQQAKSDPSRTLILGLGITVETALLLSLGWWIYHRRRRAD